MQADHAIDIDQGPELLKLTQYQGQNQDTKPKQNYNRLNLKLVYKSVFIHKNRILPYFQNKAKNANNNNNNNNNSNNNNSNNNNNNNNSNNNDNNRNKKTKDSAKRIKKKRYNYYEIILNLVLFRTKLA